MNTAPAPPGWYPHPSMANTLCYWDGHMWTNSVAPATPSVPPQVENDHTGLIIAGTLMAFLFPIGGFVAGCVLLAKGKPLRGAGMMILSLVMVFVWADALAPEPEPIYDYGTDTW